MDEVERVRAFTGLYMQPLQAQRHLAAREQLRGGAAERMQLARERCRADRLDAEVRQLRAKVEALEYAKAVQAQRIDGLTASNLALRLAGAPNAAKAELIDHVISADDSSLVLCEASYRAGRWSFSPLSSIEDARRVMDADLARADEEVREAGDCHCGGAPMCNVCGGQG